ncbi:MAG TPA: hypothetical protein VKS79_21920 [Gemmataceae bacterium]|nr:hypothetical protein [Gemmataceae bacterium]
MVEEISVVVDPTPAPNPGNRRISLIGHSGAGKTDCLLQLGADRQLAEMDSALGVTQSPSFLTALQWLVETTASEPVVVVSCHEEMLKAMQRAKSAGELREYFSRLYFVYLWKQKDRLTRHLEKTHAGSSQYRDTSSKRYTLAAYERFHQMFLLIADYTIDVRGKSAVEVAAEVRALSKSVGE